ncbi:MAG: peptidoglycan-associated lipoprotein [Alcanivoracaceae bacterium]|uniref:peptidoglycan-associated lipoprotein Pal n=1 Tax=Alcanivorax sp. MD8A TaxID=1177157 RepID=UPI000C589AF6|nr:peptidoglycan-associated lipoprotein Pal [Alcanivorax sp. MD8A]MAX55150.1 peptidoglycan-associated lipoprotein [Alcanivoracaceae bacterium]MCG8439691.1 peptidoglycan-associated lipoprotein Pal [Pseudomonadales bacterium]MED5430867.1 peptidoglycan-associated lipoprotein Pal [Pseudomonadota bacterium]MEE2869971.1 peptidoglycan-associated lipoprotein Pal [Pseudomonadota bacterium]PNE04326.1 peptidogycan-associated lipoprotein [Alcanivorax sp. MD8A]|tara:strand:+ start:437 stop:1006 length:570 start_codon:yes stop_codon:yes gene_type:complete
MRSFLNPLFALMLAAVLAACSSTPAEDDSSATTAPEPTDTSPVTPVEPAEPVKPDTSSIPLTADNFYNHPSNYDGTTDTRVIYFAFDSNTVPAAAFETLRAHATYLKNNSNAKVRLEGHADERGTREYNVALSERRSQAVEKFLRVQGVSSSQIEVVSYGEEKPAASGHSEMDWAKNRRVEINYTAGTP